MVTLDTIHIIFIPFAVLLAVIIGLSFYYAYAYDVTPTVEKDSRTLLSGQPNVYRFGQPIIKNVTYSDGSVVPSATMSIERFNQTSQKWDIIGYSNIHLHKLKVDPTDLVDISIGHTDRINIKQKAPTTISPVID